MRSLFAAALAAVALMATGCYGPRYGSPYGYSSPGYPVGSYGGYPGPINTMTPGQPYVPGGTYQGIPGGTLQPLNGGGNAPTYSPNTTIPGNNSAGRPVPTYDGDPTFQQPSAAGGSDLGFNSTDSALQPASGETFSAVPRPMPNVATPISPMPTFSTPVQAEAEPFGQTQDPGDATLRKVVLPPVPASYRPFTTGRPRRVAAY
jgi:hypothetical protein